MDASGLRDTSLFSFCLSKTNISRSPNTSRDRSANNTANNNIKIEEETPVTTAGG